MNIVKGVADLIRRSSAGHTSESGVGSSSGRFLPPSPKIHFSDIGDEAILSALWGRSINALDKAEGKKLFLMFLKQFSIVYKDWKLVDVWQSSDTASVAFPPVEYSEHDDVVFGCSAGHPAEITLALIGEIAYITAMVSELTSINTSGMISTTEQIGTLTSSTLPSEGLPVLDVLTIVTRSMHNCKVFAYYGGIQKLTALMKAAVVQLKTITSALSADENLSSSILEKIAVLQNLLRLVVLIICNFINLHSNVYEFSQPYCNFVELSIPKGGSNFVGFSDTTAPSEARVHWHQKAVVSLMEAGGLNWLVELLRVMRRLSMKEQQTDMALHFLTLTSLQSALGNNPRGQNHFRSIGGLEVLLDGLGFPSINILKSKNLSFSTKERGEDAFVGILLLHVLSLEVLRESVFGNLSNLQFLCENGRIHKFANSFCAPAFMLQEYKQQIKNLSVQENLYPLISDTEHDNNIEFHEDWKNYVVKLSRVLSSFLLSLEDLYPHDFKSSAGKTALPVSSVYGELSVKWIMRVLLTVFPCIEACSNQNQLPNYLRLFVYVLQHYVLFVLRKVLILSPSLLDIYRSEGVWEFIFSENYFYFGPVIVDCASKYNSYSEFLPWSYERKSDSNFTDQQANNNEIEILQVQVISVLELAAILTGNSHNLDIKTADWSDNVAPFWPAVIRSAFTWKGFTLLMRSGWKTIKGALVMPLMIQRYK